MSEEVERTPPDGPENEGGPVEKPEADAATAIADPDGPEDDSDLHWLQRLLDNQWLLLALGLIVPTLSYTVWAWIELLLMKKAELP